MNVSHNQFVHVVQFVYEHIQTIVGYMCRCNTDNGMQTKGISQHFLELVQPINWFRLGQVYFL